MSDSHRPVLAVSSGGGHWVQLLRLRKAWAGKRVVYVSVDERFRSDVAGHRYLIVPDANRWSKAALIRTAVAIAYVVLAVRPSVVVTTGAAPGLFAVVFGKLIRARTMWIDSIANAEELSMSGRLVARFADEWLTQWPEVARSAGPYYHGAVV